MIRFEDVSVAYDGAAEPTVQGVDFEVPEGELVLLVGPSGVGKSTILGAVSGLVPHFTGGTLRGRVTVAGRDTRTHKPRELADVVGTVGQDPLSHFVTDTVEDELAYGMESLGLSPTVMRRRVEETLDLLGLASLRDRPLATLSGGQQQRVAIGSVLTPHPRVLVLDEPTSALDPAAAEEVLAVLQRLVHDLGTTVLMAEHRLERVIQYADQVALLPAPGEAPVFGTPAEMMAVSPVYPPVVDLGRLAGWAPLPLTVRDARRRAGELRERLSGRTPMDNAPAAADDESRTGGAGGNHGAPRRRRAFRKRPGPPAPTTTPTSPRSTTSPSAAPASRPWTTSTSPSAQARPSPSWAATAPESRRSSTPWSASWNPPPEPSTSAAPSRTAPPRRISSAAWASSPRNPGTSSTPTRSPPNAGPPTRTPARQPAPAAHWSTTSSPA